MTNLISTDITPFGLKSSDANFLRYLQEIQKFPLLTPEEEYEYGSKYQKNGDQQAAKMLVQSHLRLVVKIAAKFRNYGFPAIDLVSEGNLGLIQAVKKFNPQKGFRFSTYAMWWIKAYIQEYVIRSWSLVKIGTTVAQKKLFFNLRKIKKKISAADEGGLSSEHIETISQDLNVSKQEVIDMNSRLQNSDSSLNQIIGDEEDGVEIIDNLVSHHENQEEILIENQEKSRNEALLKSALTKLNPREKEIIYQRQLSENPATLEELSQIYKISRERIRQIEAGAIAKIKKEVNKLKCLPAS